MSSHILEEGSLDFNDEQVRWAISQAAAMVPKLQRVLAQMGSGLNFIEATRQDVEAMSRDDISMSIAIAQTLVKDSSEMETIKALGLTVKANMAVSDFDRLGAFKDLDEAIDCLNEAVLLTPDGDEYKSVQLGLLGASLYRRFDRVGDLADVDAGIEYLSQAVLLTPDGDEQKPALLGLLGTCLCRRFDRVGDLADVDVGIEHLSQAVLLTPDDHIAKPSHLGNLGNAYVCRFGHLGDLADADKAVEYQSQASLLSSDSNDERKRENLNNLGNAYQARFDCLGKIADVDRAIEYRRQALMLTPDDDLSKPGYLNNLGISYICRFDCLGEISDLDKAIEYETQVILLTDDSHPERPGCLNNLGNAYRNRFEELGRVVDLEKAIEFHGQAVLTTPDNHLEKPTWLMCLGSSYQCRFGRLGERADIDKAIECESAAMTLIPDGHAKAPDCLGKLSASYALRFRRLGGIADIEKAIECLSQAVQLTPDGHVNKPGYIGGLGRLYHFRFEHLGNLADLERARSSFQCAAQLMVTNPTSQIDSARRWAALSTLLGLSPKLAYERGMELIPHLIWLGTTIERRYSLLAQLSSLAREAAAWAISVESYDLAIEWLEEGRSIVWNQILQLRTPFDDLSATNPVLARRLKDISAELEAAGSRGVTTGSSMSPSFDPEQEAQRHRRLANEWEELLREARTIPGFQNFMRPRKAADLKLAATDGPIVLINIHCIRCDALIIFPQCDDIIHLPLDDFCLKATTAREMLGSLIGHQDHRAGGFKRLKAHPKPEGIFKQVLATLWSDVVKPVLDILACTRKMPVDELPHVTWCATGALSFLPLHAAGCYDGSQPNAFDLVVSSYTPTLTALLSPTSNDSDLCSGVLAVGQQDTLGFSPLPNVVQELSRIKGHAQTTRFRQLDGANATVDEVLRSMEEYSWVHLACHATQNPSNPAHSAFHLYDGELTLETITKRAFKNKGLAFLSACQTAAGDDKLPDESVHLAAGMMMAGYPSVIGTMWAIYDNDAPEIASQVYAELLKDGEMNSKGAARALHKAVAGLRGMVGLDGFERWVPFIHIGA